MTGGIVASRYRTVRGFALRLLLGEVIEQLDNRGRTVCATRTNLIRRAEDGSTECIAEGDAFEVAAALARMRGVIAGPK